MFAPPRGTRDLSPEEMERRLWVVERIRDTYERFGFLPLETPAFEPFEMLAKKSGEDIKNEIYYFRDKAGRELGLRFDFTVPLARYVSNHPNIILPFKRYQIGKVWRYDEPQRMRYREFWQADVDVVGSPFPEADAECVAAICKAMKRLGFSNFKVRVNDRRVVESLAFFYGIKKESMDDVFRIVDKLEKIGEGGVRSELKKRGLFNEGFLKDLTSGEGMERVREKGTGCESAIRNLEDFFDVASSFGIKKMLEIDLSLVRGLSYYTGIVYEISVGERVSVGGGGRYDNLISQLGGKSLPATGGSIGIDRIIDVMTERKMFGTLKSKKKVFIVNVGSNVKKCAEIANILIDRGITAEFDLKRRNVERQVKYAVKRDFDFLLFVGDEEVKSGIYTLKNVEKREEKRLALEDIVREMSA